ncbi:MAG TPA: M28 family metallopeptidase, partial [Nakamurella multipartita]|nr:M28 family metallopeptidase [Nakamurella multipartita]
RARELGMRAVQVPGPGGPAAGADITGLEELVGVVEQFVSGREGEGPAAATGEPDGATIHLAVLAPAGAPDEARGSMGHRVRLGALSVQIDTEPIDTEPIDTDSIGTDLIGTDLIGTDLIDTERSGRQASSDASGAPRSLDRLHLVVQNGRTFQQEHPDVPVLADQGRYLVVDLDPATARELDGPDQVCFSVLPLPLNTTVFARAVAEPVAEQPWIRELVDRVAAGRFRMDLDKLVAFGSRYSTSSAYRAAATATRDELAAQGYAAVLVPITVQGRQSWNVVADHPGSGPQPRPVVLVTAHLDSINQAGGPQAMAPGADDNASGCAGLLTFARVFGTHPSSADLRLILFGGEEQGLFGSRQYVAGLDPAERARIAAVVNMDMIGTLTTQRPTVLIEGAAVSRPVMDGLSAAAATYTSLIVQTSLHPYNSDHVPFLDAAIPAVLTIEGADGANDRVHTDQDLARFVDDELAVQILRMNVAFVAEQLGRAGDPG